MQRSKLGVWLLCLLLSLSLLASCGGGDKETEKGGTFSSKGSAADGSTFDRGSQVEESAVSAEDFYGCWEDTSGSTRVWLTIFGDGTYVWLWDDGYGSAGECWMEGDELILESGTRFILSGDGGIVGDDGSVLYPGQVPDELSGLLDYR